MKLVGAVKRPEQIEKHRRLVGVLDAGVAGARRVKPPAGRVNQTMEPIEPTWQAIKEWIPDDEPNLDWFNRLRNPSEPDPDWFDQRLIWKAPEILLDDGRTLVLDYTFQACPTPKKNAKNGPRQESL